MDVVGGNDNYFILEWYMNKKTRRNERKAAQLEHTKKKLKDIKIKPKSGQQKYKKAYKKKLSLVKSLKNLQKRIIRKEIKNARV
ncbi:uncharacterized protein METZ01_LOCUS242072 [marine metagenome]|uniref:Uncharacterized protein n=1 Tax=marine metagenome TaxID=408172 RepID=A0A382HPJ3_9ZZZZ